tara:strand:- start:5511 stop:7406 length:1896 start_codon:yes stop_codon:yes gene_type:complete
MRFISILVAVWALLSANAFTQVASDTLQMKEITVTSTRYRIPVIKQPSHSVIIDSAMLANTQGQSLGETLRRYSSIFVRSNAPGAISIASFRGFGGEQTRVLWEGMPINHSMLGLVDLSLLKANSFSFVEVSPGSGSAMYGSGISGSVSLSSSLNSKEITAGQSIGSNSNYITFGKAGFASGNWVFGLGGSFQQNENNYRYFDRNTEQEENRRHAEFDNNQVQVQAGWQKEDKRFQSKFWYLKSDHEIPENVFVGSGTSRQYDAAYRWINSFNFRSGKTQHSFKVYLAQTELDYFDPNRDIESLSTGREWNNEWSVSIFFSPKFLLTNVATAHFSEVKTNNYSERKYRSVLSEQLMAELNLSDKLGIFPGFRMDYYNDFGLAMSPSLGVNYQFIDEELYIHTQASRNFRAPTFNDLYWPQGGNENLDPETAVKLEAGIGITDNWIGIGDHDLTFFRADISNGIRWTPGASAFFQAQNYLSLLSYGVEWTASKDFQIGAYKINYTQSSGYTRSTIDEPRFDGDAAVNNQLPYVPKWKYSGSLSFEKQNIRASLYGNWVSERFSTEQNNLRNPEPSYFVLDASVGYSKTINQTIISLGFQVNNVLDEQYEVVRLYPQPLRNFLITLTIKQKTN